MDSDCVSFVSPPLSSLTWCRWMSMDFVSFNLVNSLYDYISMGSILLFFLLAVKFCWIKLWDPVSQFSLFTLKLYWISDLLTRTWKYLYYAYILVVDLGCKLVCLWKGCKWCFRNCTSSKVSRLQNFRRKLIFISYISFSFISVLKCKHSRVTVKILCDNWRKDWNLT